MILLNKVNCLLRRLNAPKYLNKYGPKKYTLAEKIYNLFLRTEWKSSFRRTVRLCNDLNIPCSSKSTLHYLLVKIPWNFIKSMLQVTINEQVHLAALDASTLQLSNPSWYYIQRAGINIKQRKNTKLSIMIDTKSKKILAARFRKKIVHDIKDVKYLINTTSRKPTKIVADKAYDAEWFREFLYEEGIDCCIPIKGKAVHGYYRKRSKCDHRTYNRRPMVENSFSRLKQLYGRSINCITARNQRAEVFLRMICYNINYYIYDLGQRI